MSKRRESSKPVRPQPTLKKSDRVGPADNLRLESQPMLRLFVLAVTTAFLLVRWLVPTESVSGGDPVVWGDSRLLTETQLLTAGWLCLAAVWSLGNSKKPWVLGWVDIAVWLLVGGHIVAAICVLLNGGDRRTALNLGWEWFGIGISFTLLRQLLTDISFRRGLVTVLIAGSIVLAGFGLWQRYVWYPQRVAEYNPIRAQLDALEADGQPADPGRAVRWQSDRERLVRRLEELGVSRDWQQGTARALFESRLRDSSEPFGKFALANNFGGLLMCWLIVLIAQLVGAFQQRSAGRYARLALLFAATVLVGYCMLLTKSRTAFLGLLVGLAVYALAQFRVMGGFRSANSRPWGISVVAGIFGIAVLAGVAYASGGIDRQVLAEAGKSLSYRLQYWQGSWDVIQEHPILGVGPGNFRQYYLAHKLPESSEEIADPHNLFLDAWANGGILAFLGVILLVMSAIVMPGGGSRHAVPTEGDAEGTPDDTRLLDGQPDDSAVENATWVGGSLAFLLAITATLTLDESLIVLGVAWGVVVALLNRWDCTTAWEAAVWRGAALGLIVHLLGAHGIGMPAISQTLLLCVALGTTASGFRSGGTIQLPVGVTYGTAGLLFVAAVCCLLSVTRPVMIRDSWQREANLASSPGSRERALKQAAVVDPLSGHAFRDLALLSFQQWEQTENNAAFETSLQYAGEAIARNPMSDSGFRLLGQLWQARFEKSGEPADALRAAEAYAIAVKRYPHAADLLSDLTLAWAVAGRPDEAAKTARLALNQDEINREAGHRDKFLSEELVTQLKQLAEQGK